MITIENDLNLNIEILENLPKDYEISNLLLLDIETTGFLSEHNQIYLIGCIFFKENKAKLIQWLCEKESDEYELLFCFSKLIKDFKYILYYNGSSFDIPFIKKRLSLFQIKSSIESIYEIDLYSKLRPIQKYLDIENLKLISVEKMFGFLRKDSYNGGELITIYKNFIKEYSSTLKSILLLHNEEDLTGLFECIRAFKYINFFNKAKSKQILIEQLDYYLHENYVKVSFPYNSGFELIIKKPPYNIHIMNNYIHLSIPIVFDTLKFFYPDYHNYIYLPKENKVIHKSIAKYVDKYYKSKATKENCYIKKRGKFIPLLKTHKTKLHNFQYGLKDLYYYVELTDELLKNQEFLHEILINVLLGL